MTRLLVLGLLDEQPMSGYDIQQKVVGADAERWGGILVGSIYYALKKLEQESYIELTGIENTGLRQKAVYKITDLGKDYLQSMILDSLCASSVTYPTTLYSGLSLLHKAPKDKVCQSLEAQKKLLDKEYSSLEEKNKSNADTVQETPLLSRLVIDNMFSILRQQQQFIDDILKALEHQDK